MGLTVWKDKDYHGANATIRQDMPDLSRVGFGDAISSFRIAQGEYWEACDQVNYRGRCQVLSGSSANLDGTNWNDRIMSIRRATGNESRRGDGYRRDDVGRRDDNRRDDRGVARDRNGVGNRREAVLDDAARACTDEVQRRGYTVSSTTAPTRNGSLIAMDMQVRRNSRGRVATARCSYDPRNGSAQVNY